MKRIPSTGQATCSWCFLLSDVAAVASPELSFQAHCDIAVQAFSVVKALLPEQKPVENQEEKTGKAHGCVLKSQETLFLRDKSLNAGVGSHSSTHIHLLPRTVI